jgi:hypothetical protein
VGQRVAVTAYVSVMLVLLWFWFALEHPEVARIIRDNAQFIEWAALMAPVIYVWMGRPRR